MESNGDEKEAEDLQSAIKEIMNYNPKPLDINICMCYVLLGREKVYKSAPLPIGNVGAMRSCDPGICGEGIFRIATDSVRPKLPSVRRYSKKNNVL